MEDDIESNAYFSNLHGVIDRQNAEAVLLRENGLLKIKIEKLVQILDWNKGWLESTAMGKELLRELKSAVG